MFQRQMALTTAHKHSRHWNRLTCAGRVTYDVTTDDGTILYIYVTKYAAIHCKEQVWA